MVNILIGIVAISVIIFAHELGHFLTAKMAKVKVEEFGFGYPPRLLSFKRGDTIYSLNALPFGGFTKMAGEEDPAVANSLASKGIGTRLLVMSAGSLMNILLALFLFSLTFMIPHDVVTGNVTVEEVSPDSPASMAGIEAGDVILSFNNKPVTNSFDLSRYIQLNLGKQVSILVQHTDGTTQTVELTPRWKPPESQGAIGIKQETLNAATTRESYPFWRAIPLGANGLVETLILYKNGMVGVIMGAVPAEFMGPVGIVQATGEIAKYGIIPLLEFAALISLILGIFNLFPLPALDGGHAAFVLLEWVRRGKRISPKKEGLVHLIGFILLLALLVAVTFQDIIRIISGESLIP